MTKNLLTFKECRFSDTIINSIYSFAIRDPVNFFNKIFLWVKDDLICSSIPRFCCFGLGAGCSNYKRSCKVQNIAG